MINLFSIFCFFAIGFILFFFQGNFRVFFPIKKEFFDLILVFDWIRVIFVSLLLLISARVLVFSLSYMQKALFQRRFFWLVLCFIFSMIFIIIFPMRIFMLIGWDGLGLFSFLLVRFYKARSRWSARMKTFLTNRVGDSFFILFFCLEITNKFWFKKRIDSWLVLLVFVLACFTKSAQVPFRRWLPAAMAAPTPVSSLVHSSTLVTAGVYLIIRRNIQDLLSFIGLIGMLTAIVAAFSAIKEYDSKKIVALSTLSKLGIMVFAFCSGIFYERFFHLLTHAVAKANLFIRVGWLMIRNNHHQDLRLLKANSFYKFIIKFNIRIRIWSLSGLTFFSGYFSKDGILESYSNSVFNVFFWRGLYLIVILSFIYCFRLLFMLRAKKRKFLKISFEYKKISFSFVVLRALSLFLGISFKNFFLKKVFIFRFRKFIILLFILFSFLYVAKYWHFQSWIFKELSFINYFGGSLGIILRKKSEFSFRNSNINLFSKVEKNFVKIKTKIVQFFTRKRLNLVFWSIFFYCLVLI